MSFFARILDGLLPPLCVQCRTPTQSHHALCGACWSTIRFINRPYCACCGLPFAVDYGPDTLCGECIATPPAYSMARAAFVYDDASKPLVLGFKHSDQIHLAPSLAQLMVRMLADMGPVDCVVPVPLHWQRLIQRRYNQSALLAAAMARAAGLPYCADLLSRQRRTPSQGGLTRAERFLNIKRAFMVRERYRGRVQGQHIVLVDDVMTTGATVQECAKTLKKAGAAKITVLTLARAVRE